MYVRVCDNFPPLIRSSEVQSSDATRKMLRRMLRVAFPISDFRFPISDLWVSAASRNRNRILLETPEIIRNNKKKKKKKRLFVDSTRDLI